MKDSKMQYPAQSGAYAVKVKYGNGWSSYKTARFQISVGQEYHENEKFKATMEWARHRFEKVIICVNDTLQRYNFLYGCDLTEEEAFVKTQSAGSEWIERNISSIQSLPNYKIQRWEDWRNNRDFYSMQRHVESLYRNDPLVKDLIKEEVLKFWKRKTEQQGIYPAPSFEKFREASTAYLLEETAAFFLMFKQQDAVDVYPGSVLLPCVLAAKYCKNEKARTLGKHAFTRIDFSRNSADRLRQTEIESQ